MKIGLGIGLAATALFAVVLVLYATGPSRKASGVRCAPTLASSGSFCVASGDKAYVAVRTNAWERFKGAITGDP